MSLKPKAYIFKTARMTLKSAFEELFPKALFYLWRFFYCHCLPLPYEKTPLILPGNTMAELREISQGLGLIPVYQAGF